MTFLRHSGLAVFVLCCATFACVAFLLCTPAAIAQQSSQTPLVLSRSLAIGSSGSDVTALQQFLKQQGYYTYPTVTGYFGVVTAKAVSDFQTVHSLEAVGSVGPLTRALVAKLSQTTSTPAASTASASQTAAASTSSTAVQSASCPVLIITRSLTLGSSGTDVMTLQQFLQQRGFYTYPTITGYFGAVTAQAVSAFQAANGIEAVGNVGPVTRIKITALTSACSLAPVTQTASGTTTTTQTTTTTTSTAATTTTQAPIYSGGGGGGGGGGGSGTPAPDTTAPSVPVGLTANVISSNEIDLAWTASTDNVAVANYQVFRNGVQVGTPSGTSFADTGLTASTTYVYTLTAIDTSNNISAATAGVNATTSASGTPDTTPPTVSVSAPTNGATVGGTAVAFSATASDNVAVAGVTFYINGVRQGSEDTSSPYAIVWDSTATTSGSKTIFAVARDTSNNYATSSSIVITSDNTAPTISLISSGTPSASSATITWTTNENATSKVVYGLSTSYGSVSSNASLLTSHSLALSALSASTLYHYEVVSADSSGNTSTSTDQTFTTTASGEDGSINVVDSFNTSWHTLKIGAGGWLVGMDIASDGTKVVRPDTWGAYLWDGTMWKDIVTSQSMPATAVGVGVAASAYEIRIAPSNTNRFYMMFNGRMYRTDNQGTTWALLNSFSTTTAASNDNYRYNGEKMAVDPANQNVVYVGSEATTTSSSISEPGLTVSSDGGTTWTTVSAVGTSAQGITGIAFDPSGGTTGGKTNIIYASPRGGGVWESTNAGASWSEITSAGVGPTQVDQAEVANGIYYAVDGTSAWKYSSGTWTDMDPTGGWHTIAVDPADGTHIVIATGSGAQLTSSYDGGSTWHTSANATRVATDIPWLAWTNENYMSSGNMIFDPSASDSLYFSEGIGVWRTTPPTSGISTLTWTSQSLGIEQLVSNSIISAPGNTPIYTSWDRPVFAINPDVYPSMHGPNNAHSIISGWDSDYASNDPTYLLADMDWSGTDVSGYSTDGGVTWTQFGSTPAEYLNGGAIAAASSTDIVWAPENNENPYYSLDGGQTWNQITIAGVPTSGSTGWGFAYYLKNKMLTADRVNIGRFYMFNNIYGMYRSTDGGVTWSNVASSTGVGGGTQTFLGFNQKLLAVPGYAGNLFFTGGPSGSGYKSGPSNESFTRSVDGGANWTQVSPGSLKEVRTFGYGAPKVPGGYPSIYVVGWYNNVYGIWQSTDNAQTWTQVGQWPLNSFDNITTISGDMNTYGRIYVGFSGSGSAYGDTADAASSVWVTAPAENQVVSGTVTVNATHNGQVPATSVQFKVDGTTFGSAQSSAPYSTTWDSTQVSDGKHLIQAVTLGNGMYATSSVQVLVQNGAPVISNISSSVGVTGATSTITWTTNANTTSEVLYGTTASYGSSVSNASLVTSHSIGLSGLTTATLYHYAVVSADTFGHTSTSSDQTFTTSAADVSPPTAPGSLAATASSTLQNDIDLTWTASTDNISVAGYNIMRNGSLIATTSATAYSDAALAASTAYTYIVTAFDGSGNLSASSTPATATTAAGATWALTASPALQNLGFAASTATFSGVNIGTPASDRIVVVGAYTSQPNSTTTSVSINGVAATFVVASSGGRSSLWYAAIASSSTTANIVLKEPLGYGEVGIQVGTLNGVTAAPVATSTHTTNQADPQTLSAVIPSTGVGIVFGGLVISTSTLPVPAWTNAVGDSATNDITNAYQILIAHSYVTGSPTIGLRSSSATSYNFTNIPLAFASWGPSVAVALTAPAASSTLGGTSVTLSATSTGSVAISNVQFKVDNTNIGSADSSAPYSTTWDSTGVADGVHTLYAVALGSNSMYATSSVSITVDNTPPSAPGTFTATPFSSTEIDLAWASSTDNIAVSGYKVYRNGAQIGTSTMLSFADQGLTQNTSYTYEVKAYDGTGNLSASSTLQTASTPTGSTQVVIGSDSSISTTLTTFAPLSFIGANKTAEAGSTTMPFSGTIESLYLDSSSVLTSGQTWTLTLRKNAASSTVTCTINSSSGTSSLGHPQCSDVSHFLTFNAGDHIQVAITPSGTPNLGNISWSAKIVPTNAYDTYLAAESASTLNTSLEAFYPFSYIAGVPPFTTQASTTPQVLGEAGTLKNLFASLLVTTGSGKSQAFTVMNGLVGPTSPALASSTLACTISNGTTCNDTSDTTSIAAGNLIDLANTPAGTPGGTNYGMGVDFVPSTSGNFDLLYTNNSTMNGNTTGYFHPSGTIIQAATEASTSEVTNAMTVTAISVWIGNAPGGTQNRIYTIMKNQSPTSITCTITGTANTCSGTGSVSFSAGDLIDVKQVGSATSNLTNGVSVDITGH